MSSAPSDQTERVALGRLWWVGLVAALAAVIANAIVANLAVALFGIPREFAPLTLPQYTFFTVIGVAGAVIVFAVVGRYARRPIRTYTWIAVVVLILSFIPDFGMLAAKDQVPFPGVSLQSVGTLMFMHVVVAAISVGLLTTLGREKQA